MSYDKAKMVICSLLLTMAQIQQQACTDEQVTIWLRGLLTLAWADGDFDQSEQQLVASITHHDLTPEELAHAFQPVTLEELQVAFGENPTLAEDFLRTAVMVAIADGLYTSVEDELLRGFCQVLGTSTEVLDSLRSTLCDPPGAAARDTESATGPSGAAAATLTSTGLTPPPHPSVDALQPVRSWLDHMEVHDPKVAHFLCKLIPSQCPFERDVALFGKKIVHIPPMCKLNPLYDQLVGLRFRALSYLADECGEDVTPCV
jgi:tellurite resistance protein